MSYSTQVRNAALATYAERGLAAAAREHGIPARTITRWARADGVDLADTLKSSTENARAMNSLTRSETAARWCDVGAELLDRVKRNLTTMPAGDVKNLVTAAAICADKVIALTAGLPADDSGPLTEAERREVEDELTAAIVAEAERIVQEWGFEPPMGDESGTF